MKTLKKISLPMLAGVFAFQIVQAQNYKAPKIDASGKITDYDGKQIGSMTKEGVFMDAMGMKVAFVDANGVLVDMNGKKLGKAQKNGNFLFPDNWEEAGLSAIDILNQPGEEVNYF